MKSKKIIAMIVAFAAFMAVATSGFAAVTTTTTYNQVADKVVVNVDVTEATPGSEVTYLVKNSEGQIVYIDQKTATDGAASFDYKIAKGKITDLITDVKFGTNGAAITDTTPLYLANVAATTDANATIAFYKDAECETLIGDAAVVGTEDVIFAKVTVADGFEIDSVVGLEETATANVYKVAANAVSVTTKATVVAPGVTDAPADAVVNNGDEIEEDMEINGETVAVKTVTKVFKVVGTPSEVGVKIGDDEYPAYAYDSSAENGQGAKFTSADGLCAVRVIVGKEVVIDGLEPYFKN
jgi:hypothetical protein